MVTQCPTTTAPRDVRRARQVTVAALIGTTLEWYDFFIFGTAAALVFNKQFFVSNDPIVGVLASFATLAVGFGARPIGGLIFGRLGDRIGRRTTVLITIGLIGLVTGLIGVLPNYRSIGVWAPVALVALRLTQGLALGGEWSGAVVMTGEHAPSHRRALYTAIPLIGSPLGTLLSSGAFLAVAALPGESFNAWGWRLPFLAAFPMLLIALYIRWKLDESPDFRALVESRFVEKSPVSTVLRSMYRQLLAGAAASLIGMGGFYLVTTFVISYGTRVLHLSRSLLLSATLFGAVAESGVLITAGYLALRYGVYKVAAVGGMLSMLVAWPVFLAIDSRQPVVVVIAIVVAIIALNISYGVCGTLMAGLFPAPLRYTGVALASNTAATFSGAVPLLATYFSTLSGNQSWPNAALFAAMGAITTLGALRARSLAADPHAPTQHAPLIAAGDRQSLGHVANAATS
ncbi:MFS transporter [Mycobacterium stomatepiae]|uniref:MFS transporter n=1 Tax=Mycobacterium stomatepiae TaxID=470076 RepID=A0A7I7Q0N9_9MYCO|nr:MFS transporter [Mycobacterium stomatepiae]